MTKFITVTLAIFGFLFAVVTEPSFASSIHYTSSDIRELRKQAKTGNVQAMAKLGGIYAYGLGPKVDMQKALPWLEKAAEAGNSEAQTTLGQLFLFNDKLPRDDRKAFYWFSKSAQQGDPTAQYLLARIYETSDVVGRDYRSAYEWKLKAAKQGDPGAISDLQAIYVYGLNVVSFDEMYNRVRALAEKGDADAQWRLAWLYRSGVHVAQNDEQSMFWLKKSADQGNAHGMALLAIILHSNDSTGSVEIEDLFERAAAKGSVSAQEFLITIGDNKELTGLALEEHEARAFRWTAAAAEKGYPIHQFFLSDYYKKGRFVPKDLAEAHKWFLLSQRYPHFKLCCRFADVKDVPATEDDEAEGERRAKVWLDTHPELWWETD